MLFCIRFSIELSSVTSENSLAVKSLGNDILGAEEDGEEEEIADLL
jgi:hypothetical protein